MAVENLTKANPDGTNFGQSTTDKIGFYGLATPIAQPAVTHLATCVLSQVATSGKWAFSSSTVGKSLVSLFQSLQTKLDALNLVDKT